MMSTQLFYLFIAFFICMLLAWLFSSIVRHRERMALIEKGINPDESSKGANGQGISLGLKVGIVVLGLSVGLAIISILVYYNSLGRSNATPLAILGCCVGGALILANRISKK